MSWKQAKVIVFDHRPGLYHTSGIVHCRPGLCTHPDLIIIAWGFAHIQDFCCLGLYTHPGLDIVAAWGYAHIQAHTSSIDHFIA